MQYTSCYFIMTQVTYTTDASAVYEGGGVGIQHNNTINTRYAKSAVAANLFGQRVTSLRYRCTHTHTCSYTTKYDTRSDAVIIII